jgi:competence protein ComEC
MTKSKIVFCFCVSFISGIFFGSIINFSPFFNQVILIFGLSLISVFWKDKKVVLVGFCLLFFSFGVIKILFVQSKIENNSFLDLYNKNVVLIGRISGDPDKRDRIIRLTLNDIEILGDGEKRKVSGKLIITGSRYPEFRYGEIIKVEGGLEEPQNLDGFDYKGYLLKDGIYGQISFPKIEMSNEKFDYPVYKNIWFSIYSQILFFKEKARVNIRENFSPPYSSILEGMILGDNGAISQDLKTKLNTTGLRHIIAISGSHIVILSSIVMSFLLMIGFYRGQAFYLAISTITLYIITSGLPASAVRAGIMGGLFLLSQKVGRKNCSARSIIIACAIMLALNPLLLFYDAGFQLSFLASLGIIYLSPILNRHLTKFLKKKENLKEILATTLAPQIFTLPLLIFNFGSVSLVSPITNILIAPAVYGLMILGFLATFLGMLVGFLGQLISIPLWFFLYYFNLIVELFSQKWAIIYVYNVSWPWIAVFYLILFITTRYLVKKQSLAFLNRNF